MTAILLNSNKEGQTGWISLRRGNSLKVQGIEDGDKLIVYFKPLGRQLSIVEDGFFSCPPGAEHVLVRHEYIPLGVRENGGGVNVDLVRVKV